MWVMLCLCNSWSNRICVGNSWKRIKQTLRTITYWLWTRKVRSSDSRLQWWCYWLSNALCAKIWIDNFRKVPLFGSWTELQAISRRIHYFWPYWFESRRLRRTFELTEGSTCCCCSRCFQLAVLSIRSLQRLHHQPWPRRVSGRIQCKDSVLESQKLMGSFVGWTRIHPITSRRYLRNLRCSFVPDRMI